MEEREYSVSEAVRLIGVESHVLRYWEEELHVPVGRSAQGHRMYSAHDIELFQRTKELKECGIQLKAIRLLLEGEEKGGRKEAGLAEAESEAQQIVRSVWRLERSNQQSRAAMQPECPADMETQPYTEKEETEEPGSGDEKNDSEHTEKDLYRTFDENKTAEENEAEDGQQESDTERQGWDDAVYEIVPDEKKENLRRFEAILKRLIAEAIEEQNEKLERVLCETIREEAENLFDLYQAAIDEAAAAKEGQKKSRIRKVLERYFGKG